MFSGFQSFGSTVPSFGFPSFGSTVPAFGFPSSFGMVDMKPFGHRSNDRVVQALSGLEPTPVSQAAVPQSPLPVNAPPASRRQGYRLLGTVPTNPYLDV